MSCHTFLNKSATCSLTCGRKTSALRKGTFIWSKQPREKAKVPFAVM